MVKILDYNYYLYMVINVYFYKIIRQAISFKCVFNTAKNLKVTIFK